MAELEVLEEALHSIYTSEEVTLLQEKEREGGGTIIVYKYNLSIETISQIEW